MCVRERGVSALSLGINPLGETSVNLKYYFQAGDTRDVCGCVDAVARRVTPQVIKFNSQGVITTPDGLNTRGTNFRLVRKVIEGNRGLSWVCLEDVKNRSGGKGVLVCSFDATLQEITALARELESDSSVHIALGRLSQVDASRPPGWPRNVNVYANMTQLVNGTYI